MKNKNLAQVYLEVDEFSTRIKNKYGVNVGVYVKGKITGLSITLHELHKVIESAIMELHPEESGQMDFKTRRRPLINYQHSFALVAWEKLGYSKTEVARYMGKNHATIINSIRKAEGFLDVCDTDFTGIHKIVLKKFNEYVGTISEDSEETDDTKPVLSTLQST